MARASSRGPREGSEDTLRIKSLQIAGFKSFASGASFSFGAGITAIVGPNGCGKSNVVDAIRWAMGEQSPRRLRGKGMEDVIFAGSDARAPVGLSEVTLTFDNSDGVAPPAFAAYAEIQISRRLYRSGDSEYLINRTPCRLRDVLDFFRDTGIGTKGYTIVEQGRIAEIVSARPEDRRGLIEEAAGISKFKARRREAERKLESTGRNLLRVRDILGEIRRQISSIERQARRAARYKRLREMQRHLDLSLSADERADLQAELKAGRARLTELRNAAAAAESRLAECESGLEQSRLALAERERILSQGNEALLQLRGAIKELESQISYQRRERASLAETGEAREREREQLQAQLQAAEQERAQQAAELEVVEAALAEQSASAQAAEDEARAAEQALRTAEQERDAGNRALVEAHTRIARAEDRIAAIAERRAEIERRLRGADEQLELQCTEGARAEREHGENEEALRGLLAERERLMGLLRDAIARHAEAAERLRQQDGELRQHREHGGARRARLASLRELLARREDIGQGVRRLLEAPGAGGELGLRGLVRDGFEATPECERALEAVLAECAEGAVVAAGAPALRALEALHQNAAGRGVLVLDPPPATGESPASAESLPAAELAAAPGEPLLNFVQLRPGFEAVGRTLLGRVRLVADLSEALPEHGAQRFAATFVTRRGDVLTPDGVVRGGGADSPGPLSRVREVRELEREVAQLDSATEALAQSRAEAESALHSAAEELDNLRNRHHTAALAVATREKDLERTQERVKALDEAQQGRATERDGWLAEAEGLEAEAQGLQSELAESRDLRVQRQRQLDALGVRAAGASRELSRLEALATEQRVQREGRAESRDRLRAGFERAANLAEETRGWIAQRESEIAAGEERRGALRDSIAEAESALALRLREEEASRQSSEQKRDAYEREAESVRTLEESARSARGDLEARRGEAQESELAARELELRLQHLEEAVQERWGIALDHWRPPVPGAEGAEGAEGESPAEAQRAEGSEGADEAQRTAAAEPADEAQPDAAAQDSGQAAREAREARELADLLSQSRGQRRERLAALRKRIESIGEVNLGAIEEHEELRERFRFLEEQRGDLEGSVTRLRDAIARINRSSRRRFRETFEQVDARFRKNFPRLFQGGRAALSLTESEDVLEAGIEIMAQPPGKRLQSVNLLSGGEKTMTALALLVSVFQVRPAPFFLLDEVDAALDDANIGRFNEIVKELAADSQFLLITHNKRTIEVADVLYGVTMEERGVSKLVSVALN